MAIQFKEDIRIVTKLFGSLYIVSVDNSQILTDRALNPPKELLTNEDPEGLREWCILQISIADEHLRSISTKRNGLEAKAEANKFNPEIRKGILSEISELVKLKNICLEKRSKLSSMMTKINTEITKLNRFEGKFIRVAKEVLPEAMYKEIVDKANGRAETSFK